MGERYQVERTIRRDQNPCAALNEVDQLTQQQIARQFGLSRPKVSRLLKEARKEGVVTISVVPPSEGMADLELDLEKKYHLKEVSVVAVSDPKTPASAARELAPAAAACLVRCLSGHEVVGTEWGEPSARWSMHCLPVPGPI